MPTTSNINVKITSQKGGEIMQNFLDRIDEISILGDNEKVTKDFDVEDWSTRETSDDYEIYNITNISFEEIPADVYKKVEVKVLSTRLSPTDVPATFQFDLDEDVNMEFPNGSITFNNGDFIIKTPVDSSI